MKKGFGNRLFVVTAAAAASFLLLSGFDSTLTVEDVNEKTKEALSTMNGFSATVSGVADASIDVAADGETQSLAMKGELDYSVQITEEPFALAVSGSMAGDAAAMGVSGGLEMEMYLAQQEDGTGIVYVRVPQGEDTGWHAAALGAEDMEKMSETVKASLRGDKTAAAEQLGMDLDAINEQIQANATLAPEAVNVNGVDCYEITQSIDGDTLFSILSEVVEAMPQAGIDSTSLSAFQMLFNGIQVDAVADVSAADFTPVYAELDLGNSDFSMIGQMFGAMAISSQDASQTPEISVNVNALKLSMNYGEAPEQIEIPADALAAEIETTMSLSDAAQAVEEEAAEVAE